RRLRGCYKLYHWMPIAVRFHWLTSSRIAAALRADYRSAARPGQADAEDLLLACLLTAVAASAAAA
ncbi:hypothetical protein, partial [Streptomyces fradiae]|uniref:hypothetical protein n=1 Tax=Streptomyces fradiae TaxID=1906 RepID=UPI0039878AD1